MVKALIMRVGIDKGNMGCYAPIFEDGSFEYIPLWEGYKTIDPRTYRNFFGRKGRPLSDYIPQKYQDKRVHFDPEWETYTYGDPTTKRYSLLKLGQGDLLVFYAGLKPFQSQGTLLDYLAGKTSTRRNTYREALYFIGYFIVSCLVDFNSLSDQEIAKYRKKYKNNAHIKRLPPKEHQKNLVIVVGDPIHSKLLSQAILISEEGRDRAGKPLSVVSQEIEENLGIYGSLKQSKNVKWVKDASYIRNLRQLLKSGT